MDGPSSTIDSQAGCRASVFDGQEKPVRVGYQVRTRDTRPAVILTSRLWVALQVVFRCPVPTMDCGV